MIAERKLVDIFRDRLNQAPVEPLSSNIFEYEDKPETLIPVQDERLKSMVQEMSDLIQDVTSTWCQTSSWKSCTKLWNYIDSSKDSQEPSFTAYFLSIWCQPSQENPIPKSTAKVWFLVQKGLRNQEFTIAYRFETQDRVSVLDPQRIKEIKSAKQSSSPSTKNHQSLEEKTMFHIMNAKLIQ